MTLPAEQVNVSTCNKLIKLFIDSFRNVPISLALYVFAAIAQHDIHITGVRVFFLRTAVDRMYVTCHARG